jgi:oxygen-independent coproporphyrinogen-3 oxidase
VLDDTALGALLTGLRSILRFVPGTETTLELNPGDLTGPRAHRLRGMGFDRVSVGVQSFSDADLRVLGRRHTASRAIETVSALREAAIPSVGIDLMYGIPGQTEESWGRTLDLATSLGPVHLSCYQLTVAPDTVFSNVRLPGEDRLARLFLATSDRLESAGWEHYEVSNYALPGLRSRHNLKYWQHVPYLGLGPGAHSFDGRRRWWNPKSIGTWATSLGQGRDPAEASETLSDEQLRLESVMLGLRTSDGIAIERLSSTADVAPLVQSGHIRIGNGRIRPTRLGMLVADRLALELG